MVKRTCKDCGRPLTEEEGEYCPHCTAKQAGKVGKAGGIVGALVATTVAVVGGIIVLLKALDKK